MTRRVSVARWGTRVTIHIHNRASNSSWQKTLLEMRHLSCDLSGELLDWGRQFESNNFQSADLWRHPGQITTHRHFPKNTPMAPNHSEKNQLSWHGIEDASWYDSAHVLPSLSLCPFWNCSLNHLIPSCFPDFELSSPIQSPLADSCLFKFSDFKAFVKDIPSKNLISGRINCPVSIIF